jgi:hypothetical protein
LDFQTNSLNPEGKGDSRIFQHEFSQVIPEVLDIPRERLLLVKDHISGGDDLVGQRIPNPVNICRVVPDQVSYPSSGVEPLSSILLFQSIGRHREGLATVYAKMCLIGLTLRDNNAVPKGKVSVEALIWCLPVINILRCPIVEVYRSAPDLNLKEGR